MNFYIFPIISAALFVLSASAQLTINTPANVLSCAPLQVTFTGGTPTYILSVVDGNAPNGGALETFQNITGSPFLWTAVNYPAGRSLGFNLRDSVGLTAQSAPFTVLAGTTTSCLNQTASGSNIGTAAPAASTAASGAATTTGTTAGSSQSKAGASGSSSSTSKAASPSSSGNAAIVPGIPYGMAGVLGAAVAAVFV